MTKKSGRARSKGGKPARPAKVAHKKVGIARKLARKATIKHASKAHRSMGGGGDHYLKFSGKFTVRLPKSLHQALVERAEKEGVSLNLFVTNALSRTVAVPSKRR